MSRITQPQNARSRRTRAAILNAVWELIEQDGVVEPAMEVIAERAGTTRRTIYLHYASRGELLLGLFDHINETLDVRSALAPIEAAETPRDALAAWARFVARFHGRILPVVRAIDHARRNDEAAAQLWAHAMASWQFGCRQVAAVLAAHGQLAPPWTEATAADLLWSLMDVRLIESLVHDRGWQIAQFETAWTLLTQRTLLADPVDPTC